MDELLKKGQGMQRQEATRNQVSYIRYLGGKAQGRPCKYISQIRCLKFSRRHRITKDEASAAIEILKELIAAKTTTDTRHNHD